jgi:hypothetical protein
VRTSRGTGGAHVPSTRGTRRDLFALGLILFAVTAPLAAQDALNRVGPKTQVRSVEFEFKDKSSLDPAVLRQ